MLIVDQKSLVSFVFWLSDCSSKFFKARLDDGFIELASPEPKKKPIRIPKMGKASIGELLNH